MSRWFRFYDGALDDPKVQRLPPDVFKGWVNILCLASKHDGRLPAISDIAFALRISDREADSLITALRAAGLLDDDGDAMTPHKWADRQFTDATAAERMRRYRERKASERNDRNALRVTPVTVTSEDTDTETEKKNNRRSPEAPADRSASLTDAFDGVLSDEMARAVIAHRRALKKPLTMAAAKALAKQFALTPDPNAAAETMLAHGWQGFKAEWARQDEPKPASVQFSKPAWRA